MDITEHENKIFKERGSSLVAVLIIITIILSLIGSLMMGVIVQRKFIQQDIDLMKAKYSAEAGIFHFLADSTTKKNIRQDSLSIQLMDSSNVIINAEPFGGFLAVSSSNPQNRSAPKIQALVGISALSLYKQAVVLGDLHSALNLAGDTYIEGDVTVGPMGVKESQFKGKIFSGSIKGTVHKANKDVFSTFDKALFDKEITYCKSLLNTPPDKAKQLDPGMLDATQMGNKLKGEDTFLVKGDLQIYADSTVSLPPNLTFIVTGDLILNGSIKFNMLSRFVAGGDLKIVGNVTGHHGLFFSGQDLRIESDKPFSGQMLAERNIILSDNSYLKYPSVVYLNAPVNKGIRQGKLLLEGQSIVDGTLIIPAPNKILTEDKTRLIIGNQATVRGGIINTGQTELHGQVLGSVLTMQFYFYRSPTTYINWLKDVTINVTKRPKNFTVPLGFAQERRYHILAWRTL